jgi:glycosidase
MRKTLGALLLLFAGGAAAGPCPNDYTAGQLEHWASGSVFYQVFVRSFQDSDGDGIGDFNGLTARLDYLNDGDPATTSDLGVDALWLLPITRSPSYHGYDTVDYDAVEPDYGTDEDFDRFLAEAHRRGIKVIMDLVLNHASSQHPWFQAAGSSPDDPFHDWFIWRDEDPGWSQPWGGSPTWHRHPGLDRYYYGLFWGGMPDLNYENPAVRAEMIAVARRWLARGVDGFRLDAARHIVEAGDEGKAGGSPETHAWWREFSTAVRKDYPNVLLVGENWTSVDRVAEYFGPGPHTELDMSFNFDLAGALVGGVREDTPGLVQNTLCDVAGAYPAHALDATFLTNHDMIRVMTQLRNNPSRARLAAGVLLTLPGVPFVYYGEEIGLVNGPGDEDPEKRTPMPWTVDGGFSSATPWMVNRKATAEVNVASQQADPDSLWHVYRRLISLRRGQPALARGGYEPVELAGDSADSAIGWLRAHADSRLLVVANFSPRPVVNLHVGVRAGEAPPVTLFGDGHAEAGPDGQLLLPLLGPREMVVLDLDCGCAVR